MAGGIILFDGTCAFCERSVRFIATRDNGYFTFGASQNPEGRALLEKHGTSREATRSLILIENDEISLRSTAVLKIARRMTAPWRWASVFLLVPRPIRDAVYRVVAAIRHRIAGQSNACEIPPPEIRARLIT
jgi:predicted DCC family thiol-disulfide oxidoreductase YuxK